MSGADDEKNPDPNFQRRHTQNPDKIPLYNQAQRALLDPHAALNLEVTVELPYYDEVTGELSSEQVQESYHNLRNQGAEVTVSTPLPESFAPTSGPNPLSFDPLEVTNVHQDRVPRPTIPLRRGEGNDPFGLSQAQGPLPSSFAGTGDAPPLSFDPCENETALTPSGPASRAARQRWRIQAEGEPLSEEGTPSPEPAPAQERHGSASTQWMRPHLSESDPASYGSVDSDDHEVFAFDPRVATATPRAPDDPFQDAPTLNYEPLVKAASPPEGAEPPTRALIRPLSPGALTRIRSVALDRRKVDERLVILRDPEGEITNKYRNLDFKLRQISEQRPLRTVALTSPHPSSGTSLTALNLALIRAESPHLRVALVDLNLRHPSLAQTIGVSATPSLLDILQGEAALEQVLVRLGDTQCYLIPGAEDSDNASRLYKSPQLTQLVAQLYELFDLVVLDLPSVIPRADINLVNPLIDALVMVVAAGRTQGPHLREATQTIDREKLVGVILNELPT